jgi:hypothetical protein
MAKAREGKKEMEEAGCKGSQAYFALWQHPGDEEDPTRSPACAEARHQ